MRALSVGSAMNPLASSSSWRFIRRRGWSFIFAAMLVLCLAANLAAQGPVDISAAQAEQAKKIIDVMKRNPRGPYLQLRWFCNDGTVLPPKGAPCANHGGGYQRGELSEQSKELDKLGFRVGVLFTGLPYENFLDAGRNYEFLRELIVQSYLVQIDDGWVMRNVLTGGTARGYIQAEDEALFGSGLLRQLLNDRAWLEGHYLLATELVRIIPHGQQSQRTENIRQISKIAANLDPKFQRIRVKIHNVPEESDIGRVEAYARRYPATPAKTQLNKLLAEMRAHYASLRAIERYDIFAQQLTHTPWAARIRELRMQLGAASNVEALAALANFTYDIRKDIEQGASNAGGETILKLFDLSAFVQEMLFVRASQFTEILANRASRTAARAAGDDPMQMSRRELLELSKTFVKAQSGAGLLSVREVEAQLKEIDGLLANPSPSAASYRATTSFLQRAAYWSRNTVTYNFNATVRRYAMVEPKIEAFIDNLVRRTVALPLSYISDYLANDANAEYGITHKIFDQKIGSGITGLNPGVTLAKLNVVPEAEMDHPKISKEDIVVITETVEELPPVAGILTLESGSSLSHVQLLARNLGIPNAVVPSTAIPRLKQSDGKQVFYAISPQGSVVLQDADKMDDVAKTVIAEKSAGQKATLITIDVEKLQLDDKRLLSLDELTTDDVGRKVGPKAGNLSRLRYYFKDRVAQGVTLPFGIFKDYLEQPTSDGSPAIMDDIKTTWVKVAEMKAANASPDSIDKYVDGRLEMIRKRIATGTLQPWLVAELEKRLPAEFGPFGTWGVFIRSDTNVEDLPGFTGAGLNKTVFNKTTFADIQQGIKDVWESVFSKRSYGWRQSVMDKPEHVYASVLMQKSVPNDKSGVLVTSNIETGNLDQFTVACSEGPGGAVSGESSEQLLINRDGAYQFVQQAKAAYRTLLKFDEKGGSVQAPSSGRSRILEDAEIAQLVELEKALKTAYPNNIDDLGRPIPWDVEFGFLEGQLKLFQIRQINENRALKSLRSLTRLDVGVEFKKDNVVDLSQKPGTAS
jgi:hypothetical protein